MSIDNACYLCSLRTAPSGWMYRTGKSCLLALVRSEVFHKVGCQRTSAGVRSMRIMKREDLVG